MTPVELEQRLIEHRAAVCRWVRDAAIDRARFRRRPRLLGGWIRELVSRRGVTRRAVEVSDRRVASPVRNAPVGCAR